MTSRYLIRSEIYESQSSKNGEMGKYSYAKRKKILKMQKMIDMLAYGSLFLDVCIALVTALSLLKISTGEFVLVPIHYLLTSVVIMSLLSGGMLVYLRHNEKIMEDMLRVKYKIREFSSKNKPSYTFRQRISQRFKS